MGIRQYGKYVLVEQKVMDGASKLFKPKGLRAYEEKLKNKNNQKTDLPETKKNDEINEFFTKIGLDRYKATFKLSGFNSLEKIHNVTEGELETMGVPPGHQIKILKYLRKFI